MEWCLTHTVHCWAEMILLDMKRCRCDMKLAGKHMPRSIYIYMCVCAHIYIYIHILYIHIYTYIVCTCIHVGGLYSSIYSSYMYTRTYAPSALNTKLLFLFFYTKLRWHPLPSALCPQHKTTVSTMYVSSYYSIWVLYLAGKEMVRSALNRYSIYLLYWYKSTNTDALGPQQSRARQE